MLMFTYGINTHLRNGCVYTIGYVKVICMHVHICLLRVHVYVCAYVSVCLCPYRYDSVFGRMS